MRLLLETFPVWMASLAGLHRAVPLEAEHCPDPALAEAAGQAWDRALELGKAHEKKEHREYAEALVILDRVLAKSPSFPEALFLKAQILWEKHRDSKGAEAYLRKVLQIVPKEDALHRLAASYWDEIDGLRTLGGINAGSIKE